MPSQGVALKQAQAQGVAQGLFSLIPVTKVLAQIRPVCCLPVLCLVKIGVHWLTLCVALRTHGEGNLGRKTLPKLWGEIIF